LWVGPKDLVDLYDFMSLDTRSEGPKGAILRRLPAVLMAAVIWLRAAWLSSCRSMALSNAVLGFAERLRRNTAFGAVFTFVRKESEHGGTGRSS